MSCFQNNKVNIWKIGIFSRCFFENPKLIQYCAYCCSFSISHLQHSKQNQIFLVQSPLFLAFVLIFVLLYVYFVIDKLSTELKQTVQYYVNRLMTKGVMIDISCNPLVELKIIFLLCRGVIFCVSSEISFRYFTTSSFRRP